MKHTISFVSAFLILALYSSQYVKAQTVSNVEFNQDGNYVKIYYDLSFESNTKLFVSTNNGQTFTRIHAVSGDIGDNVAAGKNLCITWDVFAEFDSLVSDEVVFRIEATKVHHDFSNNSNTISESFLNIPDYPRNIILLNFAYGREPQLSYGATYIREKQWGLFASISTSFNFRAAATDLVCDRDGDLVEGYNGSGHGGIPFSSEKSHSRFSILAGATFLLFPEWGIQAGIGYGQRDLGWKLRQPLNGEEWVRCEEYCVRGIELSVGTHFNLKHTSASFDIVTTMFKRLEFRIGAGINF